VTPHHSLEAEYEKFLPPPLARALVEQYVALKRRALRGDHEGVQEKGGKVAEHVLRAAQHLGGAAMVPLTSEISNMRKSCDDLEQLPRTQAHDAVRVVIPRVASALYTLRSKRRGGHTASEVDPSRTDALLTEGMADWLMAELFRLGHQLPLDQAEEAIASLVRRRIPAVFRSAGYARVLKPDVPPRDELLLLLYGEATGATVPELTDWSGRTPDATRKDVSALVKARLVRAQKEGRTRRVFILPSGERRVEDSGWLSEL
jgi:hypothetical protein